MNKFYGKIKSILYSLPFGLKAADTEIMGANISGDGNDTTINQQVNDNRVAKHLLKGEVTKEVEELRYRTYKVNNEAKKYNYIGNGIAEKKEEKKDNQIIKFTQENKLVCNDILTELKHVEGYGVERYTINISYNYPVRFKIEEFITFVDVLIDKENASTTFRFNDIRNPQNFKSKPFVTELEKLETLFSNNDVYGLSKNDFAGSMMCMDFTTFNATDEHPDVITYTFTNPELVDVSHENGEFKLTYKWEKYDKIDLTEKFFNAELEEKYKNKEKKNVKIETEIKDSFVLNSTNAPNYFIKCSKCGRDINKYSEGYIADKNTGEPICIDCYEKYLLELKK